MWLFSEHCFFSAVQNYKNAGLIHVRARFKGDLERLCRAYNVTPKIDHTPGNDYPFRMDFERATWVKIVANEAAAINYTSFKDHVHDGTARDRAYLDVWSVLRRAQN